MVDVAEGVDAIRTALSIGQRAVADASPGIAEDAAAGHADHAARPAVERILRHVGAAAAAVLDRERGQTRAGVSVADAHAIATRRGGAVVLSPALDGGYTLIGLSEMRERLFAEIPWSTSRVHQLTVERASESGRCRRETER